MKYYTVEGIKKVLEELIEHGYGRLVIYIERQKIFRYEKIESHKPEEKE